MTRTDLPRAHVLASVMDEPIFPVQLPVDVTDAQAFPEMELARLHVEAMRKEKRL